MTNKKWEYLKQPIKDSNDIDKTMKILELFGEDGWEFIESVIIDDGGNEYSDYSEYLILKREKYDE